MTLSDKIFPHTSFTTSGAITTEDVKEFIRLLKEKRINWVGNCYECGHQFVDDVFLSDINELAGEKLSK
jgi:hypothetical protein